MKNAVLCDVTPCDSVKIDVSEERIASIIRVARIGELGIKLAVTSNRRVIRMCNFRNEIDQVITECAKVITYSILRQCLCGHLLGTTTFQFTGTKYAMLLHYTYITTQRLNTCHGTCSSVVLDTMLETGR
jgi:hypothetical protein